MRRVEDGPYLCSGKDASQGRSVKNEGRKLRWMVEATDERKKGNFPSMEKPNGGYGALIAAKDVLDEAAVWRLRGTSHWIIVAKERFLSDLFI